MALNLEQIRQFTSHQLTRLLESLTSEYLLDPQLLNAVVITNNHVGVGALEIRTTNRTMTIQLVLSNDVIKETVIDLRTRKLADFDGTNPIPNVPSGVTFSLLPAATPYRNLSATTFVDSNVSIDVGASIDVSISRSPLWVLLRPVAWAFQDQSINIDIGLNQLNLLKSTGFFADFWGKFLSVSRNPEESDREYTQRIVYETLRPRENNLALATVLSVDDDTETDISDLLPKVFQLELGPSLPGNLNEGAYIPGNVFNSDNFLVELNLTKTNDLALANIKAIIEKHKAAGTRAFYKENIDAIVIVDDEIIEEEDFDISLFDVLISELESEAEFAAIVNLQVAETVGAGIEITDSCYYVIDTNGPEWTTQLTPMPRSKITGSPYPTTYEVVCNPPEPPFGFNVVALNTQTISEGWELVTVVIATQTISEGWELVTVVIATQTVDEEWEITTLSTNTLIINEPWEMTGDSEGWDAGGTSLTTSVIDERWEIVTVPLTTLYVDERWES